ncbi:MAG: 1-acyl-sn-glycerol-3-phosphate acyltransferase [Myxococcota bacterium]
MASFYRERSWLLRQIHPENGVRWGTDPDICDPDAIAKTAERIGLLFGRGRWFDLEVEGLTALPPAPAMLVSNHSGGTMVPDAWGFAIGWHRHFGGERLLRIAAHEIILSTPLTGRYFGRRGIIRAHRDVTERTLRSGYDVMIMPGGDQDVWRPHRDRYRVQFAGRKGYARLAILSQVPVVPVAHDGPHDTLYVLTDGRPIAKALRLYPLIRASVWPIHLSLPWGLALGPLPHLPLPTKFRYRVGPAIIPPPSNGGEPSPEDVADLDREVRAAVQHLLDELRGSSRARHSEGANA